MGKNNTQFFQVVKEQEYDVASILRDVYAALKEKGYNPKDQLVGYLLSGDPTYITSYKDARNKLRQYERYELVEALLESYLHLDEKHVIGLREPDHRRGRQ